MNSDRVVLGGKCGLAALGMALWMCGSSLAVASDKKAPAPSKPAAAPKSAPASRPAGGAGAARPGAAGGAASHGPNANGAGASKGPSANGAGASKGPSANGPSANHTAGGGAKAGEGMKAGGNTASKPGGAGNTAKASGPIKTPAAKGTTEKTAKDGSAIRTRSNGKVSDVHDAKHNMDIHHGLDGSKRVSTTRKDGSRVVSERGRPGYVQRGYNYHGHEYVSRAYYYHGREYNSYYRGYYYGGVYVNVYAPGYYYNPGFYGWAYNPWAAPIAYGWGWGGSPWYGYYGGFFTPYSVYPSAAFWLTDYIVSQNLQAAYAARAEAAAAAGEQAGAAPLTPEVKQMISDEVKAQLALENSESTQTAQKQDVDPASSGIGRLLSDGNPHVFVVGGSLDVTDGSGAECAVSDGDALQLVPPAPANATAVNLVVLASKGGQECAPKSTVSVQVADLQDMQNHMRETIDQGLQELQAKQGKGGLPQAPPSAQAKPTQPEFAAIAPPPDPKDAADIADQAKTADVAETDVVKETGAGDSSIGAVSSGPAASSGPAPTVALGQTPDEVTSILGKPTKTAELGAKKIYYYDGMKVTFKSGKVTDVE